MSSRYISSSPIGPSEQHSLCPFSMTTWNLFDTLIGKDHRENVYHNLVPRATQYRDFAINENLMRAKHQCFFERLNGWETYTLRTFWKNLNKGRVVHKFLLFLCVWNKLPKGVNFQSHPYLDHHPHSKDIIFCLFSGKNPSLKN